MSVGVRMEGMRVEEERGEGREWEGNVREERGEVNVRERRGEEWRGVSEREREREGREKMSEEEREGEESVCERGSRRGGGEGEGE